MEALIKLNIFLVVWFLALLFCVSHGFHNDNGGWS